MFRSRREPLLIIILDSPLFQRCRINIIANEVRGSSERERERERGYTFSLISKVSFH